MKSKSNRELRRKPKKEKVYMKIGTIWVTEETPFVTTADLPASVDVLGADQIETENVDFALELLKKVPGTYYGDWNQGHHLQHVFHEGL